MPATDVTIRLARQGEDAAVAVLSALDSSPTPADPVLVAEVDGSLWAAVSLRDRQAVADPFHPSAELVGLLRARARQLDRHAPVVSRRPLVRFPARSFTGEP